MDLAEAFAEQLHPRGRGGRFIERLSPVWAPPFKPWASQMLDPSPAFRPKRPPANKRSAFHRRPKIEVVLRRDIEDRVRNLNYGRSLRLPEGTRMTRLHAGQGFQIDGATGRYHEQALGGALARGESEENAARAARFANTIPGNPMGPLAGVDTAPDDPVGDQIGGMLHGGWVTLPHGTLVHRQPGGSGTGGGDNFEVIATDGTKTVIPAVDKEATYAAARAAERRAEASPQTTSEAGAQGEHAIVSGGGPLRPLPQSFIVSRKRLHRIATQVVAPEIWPSWQVALVPTPGGYGTPWFVDEQGRRTRVRVDKGELVRERGGELTRESIAGVDRDSAAALGTMYGLADSVIGQLKRENPDEKDDPRAKRVAPSPSIVWPEHFDIATEFGNDDHRANFGMSPGDEGHPEPYFYVGPWDAVKKSPVWNAKGFNGAELSYRDVLAAPNQRQAVLDFYRTRLRALQGAAVQEADFKPGDHPRGRGGKFIDATHLNSIEHYSAGDLVRWRSPRLGSLPASEGEGTVVGIRKGSGKRSGQDFLRVKLAKGDTVPVGPHRVFEVSKEVRDLTDRPVTRRNEAPAPGKGTSTWPPEGAIERYAASAGMPEGEWVTVRPGVEVKRLAPQGRSKYGTGEAQYGFIVRKDGVESIANDMFALKQLLREAEEKMMANPFLHGLLELQEWPSHWEERMHPRGRGGKFIKKGLAEPRPRGGGFSFGSIPDDLEHHDLDTLLDSLKVDYVDALKQGRHQHAKKVLARRDAVLRKNQTQAHHGLFDPQGWETQKRRDWKALNSTLAEPRSRSQSRLAQDNISAAKTFKDLERISRAWRADEMHSAGRAIGRRASGVGRLLMGKPVG